VEEPTEQHPGSASPNREGAWPSSGIAPSPIGSQSGLRV
ncbi:MAG: hypothetical protein AVDCRST_MAG59-5116, partial [uncultured Thermomicrobiales bacterium]